MRQPYHSQEKAVETIHVYVLREKDVALTIADDTLGDQVPDTTSEKPHTLLCIVVCMFSLGVLVGSLTFSLFLAFNPGLLPLSLDKRVDKTITLTLSPHPAPTQVQSYMLPEIIVTGEKEALSTGSIHQPATAATGLITFYNGSFTTQVVPAGIILQGNGGRRISTDQQARIPPATPTTPPTYGTVSVIAHSLLLGAVGNIPDQDINDACCGVSLLAQNIYPFSGGRDARDITVVTANDIATAVAALQTNLDQETHDQAQAEMKPGQQELPLVCTTSTTANHRPGDQAQQVHVTVTKHCLALAYTLSGVWQQVTRAIAKSIPSSYRLVRVTILLLTATVTDGKRGAGTLSLHITASLAFVPAGNRNSHGSGK